MKIAQDPTCHKLLKLPLLSTVVSSLCKLEYNIKVPLLLLKLYPSGQKPLGQVCDFTEKETETQEGSLSD